MANLSKWAIFFRAFMMAMIAATPGKVGGQSGSDDQSWARARAANTIDAYHDYLSRHPDGQYVGQAVQALRGLGAFGNTAPSRNIGGGQPAGDGSVGNRGEGGSAPSAPGDVY